MKIKRTDKQLEEMGLDPFFYGTTLTSLFCAMGELIDLDILILEIPRVLSTINRCSVPSAICYLQWILDYFGKDSPQEYISAYNKQKKLFENYKQELKHISRKNFDEIKKDIPKMYEKYKTSKDDLLLQQYIFVKLVLDYGYVAGYENLTWTNAYKMTGLTKAFTRLYNLRKDDKEKSLEHPFINSKGQPMNSVELEKYLCALFGVDHLFFQELLIEINKN